MKLPICRHFKSIPMNKKLFRKRPIQWIICNGLQWFYQENEYKSLKSFRLIQISNECNKINKNSRQQIPITPYAGLLSINITVVITIPYRIKERIKQRTSNSRLSNSLSFRFNLINCTIFFPMVIILVFLTSYFKQI